MNDGNNRDLCTECGTTFNWCTKKILSGGLACCKVCENRDTHPVSTAAKDETPAERLERLGTDPKRWAKEFVSQFYGFAIREGAVDEDTMTRWFTNVLAIGEAKGSSLSDITTRTEQERLREAEDRIFEARKALMSTGYWDHPGEIGNDIAKHIAELVTAHNSGAKLLVGDTHDLYVKWMTRANMAEDTLTVIRLALADHDRTIHRPTT